MWRAGPLLRLLLVLQAACLATAGSAAALSRLLDGDDALGSPVKLAWQAWLLMDESAASGAGAEAGGARRITPKSVFIAPAFAPQALPPCADGHKRDAAGRCVQVVHINRDAQLNFLLQRLNALHARPAPGRLPLPLPLPARVHDSGPFKVPLRVPLPIAATTTTTPAASTALEEQAPTTEDAPAPSTPRPDHTEEPPRVSVVMADMAKRSSGEQQGDAAAAGPEDARPVITVWTIENNTLHKSQNVDGEDSSFTVELPTAAPEVPSDGAGVSKVQAPLSDVLDPAEVEGALPMLVISPGTPAPTTPMAPDAGTGASAPSAGNHTAQGEGSGETSDDSGGGDAGAGTGTGTGGNATQQLESVAGGGEATADRDHGGNKGSPPKESEGDDDGEPGSADVMEHIEVVPISEHSRHNLPIMGEDHDQDTSFSQFGPAGGLAGMFRPIPLEVIPSSPQDEPPPSQHVRFPTDASDRDEPQAVHFFKGNYIKFPAEHAYRYKHRTVTEEFPDVKQTFWWIPSGWRIDQQRHQQSVPQEFWPRMSLSEDPSLFSQYNPSYPSPLPYQQRQAQYDPQWSSMRRQMTS